MPQCKYHEICGRDVEDNSAEGLCILHSTDSAKDADAFAMALATHRERNGDKFADFVFPGEADFRGTTFMERANFDRVTFTAWADFDRAMFTKGASFSRATFTEASFRGATFTKEGDFTWATFNEFVSFLGVTFADEANFMGATFKTAEFFDAMFTKRADFTEAAFDESADFTTATFTETAEFTEATLTEASFFRATFTKEANFNIAEFPKKAGFGEAKFFGKALFAGRPQDYYSNIPEASYIFAGTEVDFRQVVINPPDTVTFLGADLTKCKFLDTDLRKVQLVDITWPRKGRRMIVYDEMALVKSAEGSARLWSQIEQLYRELKQNYEDRRDYERAGDFHYGEKEMRRQNPETPRGLRFFLTLYWLFSGYGERYLRPLLWAGLLFAGSTIGYMWWGLRPKDGGASLAWVNVWDWLRAAHYSFRVMTLLKPDDWVPLRYAQVVNTFQTLLGPVFLGLFALALRQRLKR